MDNPSSDRNLESAFTAMRAGNKAQATRLFSQVILTTPGSVEAWQGLAAVIDDPARKKECHRQVLQLQPENFISQTMLDMLNELPALAPRQNALSSRTTIAPAPAQPVQQPVQVQDEVRMAGQVCASCGQVTPRNFDYCNHCGRPVLQHETGGESQSMRANDHFSGQPVNAFARGLSHPYDSPAVPVSPAPNLDPYTPPAEKKSFGSVVWRILVIVGTLIFLLRILLLIVAVANY